MKRNILTALAILGFVLNVSAQENFTVKSDEHSHSHKGRILIGGALTYWNNTKAKSMVFDLCPEFGYFFNDMWGVGLLLGYEREKELLNGKNHISNAFKISPFVRYFYCHKEPFSLFLDGGFGLNWGKNQYEGDNAVSRFKGFEIGVRPGASLDLTEGLCLCMRMGFIGYRNNFFMGEEPGLSNNGFGIRFAPEELMIGLELEF